MSPWEKEKYGQQASDVTMTFEDIWKEIEYKYETILHWVNEEYKWSVDMNQEFNNELLKLQKQVLSLEEENQTLKKNLNLAHSAN